ncbi:hypothetical protein FQR65_LT07489 [Abscondita terminalis]|nr:hypothetical protein FQR65_LT07489 [Abscondita terminalis]
MQYYFLIDAIRINGYGYLNNGYGYFYKPTSSSYPLITNYLPNVRDNFSKNKIHAFAYSSTNTNSNSKAQAQSSMTYTKKSYWNMKNSLVPNEFRPRYLNVKNGWNTINPFSLRGNFQDALATAEIGPKMYHQTAALFSPYSSGNPRNTNTIKNFSPKKQKYGVFTSSRSVSSTVNGKPVTYQKSSTTVNENGKVKSHTLHY